MKGWIAEEKEERMIDEDEEKEDKKAKKLGLTKDETSLYSYLPVKSEEKSVLYGSEHLYTLTRFIYALYERLIRMREVAESEEKLELFRLLFFACVKTK